MNPIFFGHNKAVGGASAFSDNFNRANSDLPGVNWNELAGDVVISSNQLIFVDDLIGHLLMFNLPMLGLTQYQKAKLIIGSGDAALGFIFRNVSDSGNAYIINFTGGDDSVSWYRYSNLVTGAGQQVITSTTLPGGVNDDLVVGITVDGLGNNTVIRVWSNPTGLPLAADNWNGDTTPNVSFTQNPPSPSDAGYRLGIFAQMENDYGAGIDDWFGGSL